MLILKSRAFENGAEIPEKEDRKRGQIYFQQRGQVFFNFLK
jgi:hypothetical protein